jgi:hypothetical protein
MEGGAGTIIGGRFRLAEPIGQGGMGRVWRGHDQVLNRDVAVKEILLPAHLSAAERTSLLARTTREAQSTARLNHPCVVTIHDVIQHDGVPWIVMEYVPGQSLGAAIADGARLPWEQVADIGAKIADGVAHAHAAGIVHRDLKPDNVLLSGDRVLVTDFGIARMVDAASRLTSTGTVMGTPHYMAPEQLEGTQAGAAADMWSLGATMYAAVEGTLPFDGPTLTAIITAILARDPVPPVHAGPLAGVLSRLLVKDPAQRPDAAAMALELRATAAAASAFGGNPSGSTAQARTAQARTAQASTAPVGTEPSDAIPVPAAAAAAQAVPQQQAPAQPLPSDTPAHPVTVASPPRGVAATPFPATVSAPAPPQPWAYPPQPVPGAITPQPGAAPWAYPGQTPPPLRPAGQDGPAIAGLVLAIVSGIAYIGGLALSQGMPGKSAAFGYAGVVVPVIVAVIALVGRGTRRPLVPYVLGAYFLSLAGVLADVLSVPAYHPLSGDTSNHAKASFLLSTLGDIAGAAAMVILLIAVRRMSDRGRWASPRVIPALLLATTALAWIAWTGVWARNAYVQGGSNYSDWGVGKFLSVDYPYVVSVVAALVLAVIAALYALGLRARVLGGVLLLGWTVNAFLYFAQVTTEGYTFPGAEVAINVVAALLMLATAVLAIVYASRKAANPVLRVTPGRGQQGIPHSAGLLLLLSMTGLVRSARHASGGPPPTWLAARLAG